MTVLAMAKAPQKAGKDKKPLPEIEIEPGAWERFKSAVHRMARPKAAKPFKSSVTQGSGKTGKAKKTPKRI
jgi:hypothetical protein